MKVLTILSFCFFALSLITCSKASDTISTNQTIRDGETIVSADDSFELGFFNTSNTPQNRYLGIWYKQFATGTVVWVANRETPINNRSGELTLRPGGLLVLRDSSTNQMIWSSNTSTDAGNVVARLLDNSNFMVVGSEDGPENYIWQSFDHPTDTLMPEMKVGRNLKRGVVTNYSSWKSDDNPSQGQYMIFMNFSGLPQLFQMKGGNIEYRLGSWNGISFAGSTNNQQLFLRNLFYMDENEIYGGFVLTNKYQFTRLKITPEGNMAQLNWNNRTQEWFLYSSLTTDSCERYAWCGVHGICDIMQSPNCGCLRGFTPKRPEAWEISDWTSGCQREIPLDCGVGEGFRKYSLLKLPDTQQSWFNRNMTLEQCKVKCTNQCNCTAYATLDIKLGSGCLLWYNQLIDMRTLPSNGQDIYIRMAAIELAKDKRRSGIKRKVWMIVIPVSLGLVGLLGLCMYIIIKKNVKAPGGNYPIVEKDGDLELPLFSLFTLSIATENFSIANKLGEGGFGPVYKGVLEDGKEIAVKRLSIGSTQGVHEFKNEVIFISKLQHRNLVKILGCCIDGEERLLVYEYMANKGLDLYIYQEANRLDWSQLFHILNGIARGLLYLHQDSHLRIIHRDLKAANILLDHDMNPKISDFGLARSFRGTETDTKTKRVVGTYGYMSPEYAGDGIISVKTDVFSFGVLVLEIVSGKRNRGFSHGAHNHNLLGHAWMLYKEGKSLELVDGSPLELNQISEVLCSIQVGLLCVQHNPDDRPNMSVVVAMLNGEGQLPEPKYPGFYMQETSETVKISCSNNAITVTLLEAR